MRDQLNERVRALKAEFEAGQKVLAELEQRHVAMEQKLLRISGAIQVLEEELGKAGDLAVQSSQLLHEPAGNLSDNGNTSPSPGMDS